MTRHAGWVVALMAAAVLGGCGSDDDPVKPQPPAGYPARTSPQNVLRAMQMAYVARDSNETKAVYDTLYVGTSTDFNDPPGDQILTFDYGDEVRHVAALAESTTISNILLDLGPSSSWTRLPSDDPSHPEWAMVQITSFHLELYHGSTLYTAVSTNPMTFAFKPTVSAPPDTTWRIVRWTEAAAGGP